MDVSSVLDNVRFTKLKQSEYFGQLSHPVMKIMLDNCSPPGSMKKAKIFHDPPVSTRSQGPFFNVINECDKLMFFH